jgi:hypothetical protein
MTLMIGLLSTEALQHRPQIDDCHQRPPLGFLRVVPTTGDDVRRRSFHVLDAEGCLKGLQPTLPGSCVSLLPTPFCTNHKPRVHNCGAVPL